MLRSLSSAVAGLRTHQRKMDVIGNNIANVNTYGFKASRATFSDVYYQTISGATPPSANRGGVNPTQVGYGSQLATIDLLMENGGGSYSGRATDIYVDGDGFLTVQDPDGKLFYTRLGNLTWDSAGNLVDYMGNFVKGFTLADTSDGYKKGDLKNTTVTDGYYAETDLTNIDLTRDIVWGAVDGGAAGTPEPGAKMSDYLTSIQIGSDGSIVGIAKGPFSIQAGGATVYFEKDEAFYIGKLAVAQFPNQDGLSQAGNSQYQASSASGNAQWVVPGENDSGITKSGYLEMANVDLAQEFTDMITTQRGFQANTRIITVSDEMLQELVNLKR